MPRPAVPDTYNALRALIAATDRDDDLLWRIIDGADPAALIDAMVLLFRDVLDSMLDDRLRLLLEALLLSQIGDLAGTGGNHIDAALAELRSG